MREPERERRGAGRSRRIRRSPHEVVLAVLLAAALALLIRFVLGLTLAPGASPLDLLACAVAAGAMAGLVLVSLADRDPGGRR
jgi:hypothetical protein